MGRRKFPSLRRLRKVGGALAVCSALALPVTAASATPDASTAPATAQAVGRELKPGPGGYVPITPFRVLDTRMPAAPLFRRYNGAPNLWWGETRSVLVAAPGDTTLPPGGAGAVSLTITVAGAPGPGYVTVWPGDQPYPGTSNVNYSAGKVVSNSVTVRLDATGRINVYSPLPIMAIIDVNGWYANQPATGPAGGGGFVGTRPVRLLDTRNPWLLKPGSNDYRFLEVVVPPDIAAVGGVRAVVLNLTVTDAVGSGYASLVPNGVWPPPVSSSNYNPGQTVANELIVTPGVNNLIYVYVSSSAHVIVDLMGYFTGGPTQPGGFVPVGGGGTRIMDTRGAGFGNYGYDAAHDARLLVIGGSAGVPTTAGAAALNVTAVSPLASGFVRVWPDSTQTPGISNLSVEAGGVAAVGISPALGPSLGVLIGSNVVPDIIVDLMGWYATSYV